MRVDNSGIHPSPASTTKSSGPSKAQEASKRSDVSSASDSKVEARGSGDVNAEISSRAKDLAQAKSVASAAPETREDKIAELKRRISEGSYALDHNAIADRLVDDHLGMMKAGGA